MTVYKELIKGESSGLSQLQLDQVDVGPLPAPGSRSSATGLTYRNDLDSFKMQMGLPPDTPIDPRPEPDPPVQGRLRRHRRVAARTRAAT